MAGRLKKHTLRWLIPAHRYLGLGMSLILLLWFASGIVMMFQGYPRTPDAERMAWLNPLDTGELRVSPAQAVDELALTTPEGLRINQPGSRPRIQLMDEMGNWWSVYADTGEPAPPLTRQQAATRARELINAPVDTVQRLDGPDQWTVNSHVHSPTPLWRVALADDAGTHLYLSEPTGEVIHSTTFHERAWGYAGPVIHWIYPTQLRDLSGVWRQVVIWLAGIGTLTCLSGVVLGLTLMRRNKRRGGLSPFRGWFRWHHYLGLTFGLLATTWVFSGLLSMGPFHWNSADQQDSLTEPFGSDHPQGHRQAPAPATVDSLAGTAPRELGLYRFNGQLFYQSMSAEGSERLHATSANATTGLDGSELTAGMIHRAAEQAGGTELAAFRKQTDYDAYYYPGRSARLGRDAPRLPVYRADYRDGSRLYIDPTTGDVLQHSTPLGRLNRWLYHGLHSLDFPLLNPGSPLWYTLVLALMTGGTLLALTGTWLSIRYLRRRRKA